MRNCGRNIALVFLLRFRQKGCALFAEYGKQLKSWPGSSPVLSPRSQYQSSSRFIFICIWSRFVASCLLPDPHRRFLFEITTLGGQLWGYMRDQNQCEDIGLCFYSCDMLCVVEWGVSSSGSATDPGGILGRRRLKPGSGESFCGTDPDSRGSTGTDSSWRSKLTDSLLIPISTLRQRKGRAPRPSGKPSRDNLHVTGWSVLRGGVA